MAFFFKENSTGKAVLVASLVFLGIGSVRQFDVLDQKADLFGARTRRRITESQLNIDATFGGVERRDGKLYSTYDRLAVRGKRACLT